jgi:hypothetical protein
MRRIEPFLATPFQRCVCGNERPVFKDADLIGENVDVENAPRRRVVSGTLQRLPPTLTMPSCEARRSSRSTAR